MANHMDAYLNSTRLNELINRASVKVRLNIIFNVKHDHWAWSIIDERTEQVITCDFNNDFNVAVMDAGRAIRECFIDEDWHRKGTDNVKGD